MFVTSREEVTRSTGSKLATHIRILNLELLHSPQMDFTEHELQTSDDKNGLPASVRLILNQLDKPLPSIDWENFKLSDHVGDDSSNSVAMADHCRDQEYELLLEGTLSIVKHICESFTGMVNLHDEFGPRNVACFWSMFFDTIGRRSYEEAVSS